MNTYEAKEINHVPELYRGTVMEAALEASKRGHLISVQMAGIYYPQDGDEDEKETVLYGVYEKSIEEVENYYRSGGIWSYGTPDKFL